VAGCLVTFDIERWRLKQKFAIVLGKTKAVDVNPSLSAISFAAHT
jgi:hypothetical protein